VTVFPETRWVGAQVQQKSGVVVEPADDFGVPASGEGPVGESDCQVWFGRSAANRRNELRGRFCGCGTTRAGPGEDPPDRRALRVGDRPCSGGRGSYPPGIQTCSGQLIAQLEDPST